MFERLNKRVDRGFTDELECPEKNEASANWQTKALGKKPHMAAESPWLFFFVKLVECIGQIEATTTHAVCREEEGRGSIGCPIHADARTCPEAAQNGCVYVCVSRWTCSEQSGACDDGER